MKFYYRKENPYLDFIIANFFSVCLLVLVCSCNTTSIGEIGNSGNISVSNSESTASLLPLLKNNRPSSNVSKNMAFQAAVEGNKFQFNRQQAPNAIHRLIKINRSRYLTTHTVKPGKDRDLVGFDERSLVY